MGTFMGEFISIFSPIIVIINRKRRDYMNWVNHPVKAAEFLHTRKSAVLIPIVETEEGESLL